MTDEEFDKALTPPTIEAFFNRPVRPLLRVRLLKDIAEAEDVLVIASAWFTDTKIAQAVIDSKAKAKTVILNRADLDRAGSKEVYTMFQTYEQLELDWREGTKVPPGTPYHFRLSVLGSGDFKEGVMHHKVIVVDRKIVWTGSYNFTFQAGKNYENILRIEGGEIPCRYYGELMTLAMNEGELWSGGTQFAVSNGAFRCAVCERLFPMNEMGEDGYSWMSCLRCSKK